MPSRFSTPSMNISPRSSALDLGESFLFGDYSEGLLSVVKLATRLLTLIPFVLKAPAIF